MSLVSRHAALSDIGLYRDTNEDAFVAAPPLFAVADGMGGAQAGEVASSIAVDTLRELVAAGRSLADAAGEANTRIFARAGEHSERAGMGTTLTALLVDGRRGRFVHIGDSRAYLLRAGELRQLSDDHSLVGEWLREGAITPEEAAVNRYRSILSRALGTDENAAVDQFEVELRPGDVVLLCSDGLSGSATPELIATALAASDPEDAARTLIREAKRLGGRDNITAVVVRFEEAAGGGDPAAETASAEHTAADQMTTEIGGAAPAAGSASAATTATVTDPVTPAADAASAATTATATDPVMPAADAASAATTATATDPVMPAAGVAPATSAAPASATAPASVTEPAAPRVGRWRVRLLIVGIAAAVLLIGLSLTFNHVYYVGVSDGYVTVYRGVPWDVGGIGIHKVYLRTSTRYDLLAPADKRDVDNHSLGSRGAAMNLVGRLGAVP